MNPKDINNSCLRQDSGMQASNSTDLKHFEPLGISKAGHPLGQSSPGGTALLPSEARLPKNLFGGQARRAQEGNKLYKLFKPDKLSTLGFYISILFFIIGFNFSDVMVGNWYQQFLPNIGGRQITDITFLDSLTGYAVATQMSDTSYILKTTNGGDNWQIIFRNFFAMTKVQFLNVNTGYACGGYLYKTTNGGLNWNQVNTPLVTVENMFVLNQDTIWFVWSETTIGGVFRTTNGGVNWIQQINLGGSNPDRIYMYNARIGFISSTRFNTALHRTTNGGLNWSLISNNESFNDMYFIDSLTGWRSPAMKKTTNGGLNWVTQTLPMGGNLVPNGNTFSNINKDTIWASGGYKFFPGQGARGALNFTSNGGDTWYFQLPDTSYQIPNILYVDFVNKRNGWAYLGPQGLHTTNGGDTTFYLPVHQISTEVPKEFMLFQNYPNPFNPKTKLKFSVKPNVKRQTSNIKITVFDITGKEIAVLVNVNLIAGEYETTFDAINFSSGIYFYSLIVDGKWIDTKKMLLVK